MTTATPGPGWELILLALSALVATLTFLYSRVSDMRRAREEYIREWQRVVVAEIFLSNPDTTFSFQDILNRYQSEAHSFSAYKLNGRDLSKQALRRILVDLISRRITDYVGDDNYRVVIFSKMMLQDEMKRMLSMMENGGPALAALLSDPQSAFLVGAAANLPSAKLRERGEN